MQEHFNHRDMRETEEKLIIYFSMLQRNSAAVVLLPARAERAAVCWTSKVRVRHHSCYFQTESLLRWTFFVPGAS